jgi:hypothetical protein
MTATTTTTTAPATYWNSNGAYQELADALQKQVPAEGHAEMQEIEHYRLVCNTYYDYNNNGWSSGVVNLHVLEAMIDCTSLEQVIYDSGNQDAIAAFQRIQDGIQEYQVDLEEDEGDEDIICFVDGAGTPHFDALLEELMNAVILDSSNAAAS